VTLFAAGDAQTSAKLHPACPQALYMAGKLELRAFLQLPMLSEEVLQLWKRWRGKSREELGGEVSGSQIDQLVDEPIRLASIIVAGPPRLPLPDNVHRFVSCNRSLSCSELAKALGLHALFDGSMILLQDVVQKLHRSTPPAPVKDSLRFTAAIAEP
jgi:hypothetical protein